MHLHPNSSLHRTVGTEGTTDGLQGQFIRPVEPDKLTLQAICCTFTAYHAVKALIRAEPDAYNNSATGIRRLWNVFADAYKAEAVEHGISVPFAPSIP